MSASLVQTQILCRCVLCIIDMNKYNLKLQIGGISQDHDFYVVDGNIKEEKFSVYYIKNKKLIAIDAINNQKEFMKGKKLIALDTEIPQEILQNIEGSLKNWIINQ